MPRRLVATSLLAAVVAVAAPGGSITSLAAREQAVSPSAAPGFTLDWTRSMPGRAVSTSSPVVVDNGGDPFVVAGDTDGNLRAFDLDTGTPRPGWSSTNTGFVVRAPLSSDGSNVYVPVAQDGKDRDPQYKKFRADGSLVWSSNPGTVIPDSTTRGFMLSGVSLARIGGAWRAFSGSSGHWVYGLDGATGAKRWSFRNADSTMATPAVADVHGTGAPQVITSNDTSKEFPHDRHGGILRILTHDGVQTCTATQLVTGGRYAASGYNNSSPAVAEVGGRALIVFGSTGPTQHGDGGNQVVAYDEGCRLRWASPPLAAQAAPSPVLADVRGTGGLQVVQVVGVPDGTAKYPRVVVLDAATGKVLDDTGSSLRGYGASLAYPSSMSIATADVDADGAQDLFVPAKQGSFLVLDGRTLSVMTTIATNMAVQNTPVVTAEPGGVRITMAGYNGNGGLVSSYVAPGAVLGERGWHSFGNDAQLTRTQGSFDGPYTQLTEGQTLAPGEAIRSAVGAATLRMQADGNLVAARADGSVRWSSRTGTPGSSATLLATGELVVRSPGGTVLWRTGGIATGVERLGLSQDGTPKIFTASWVGSRRLNDERLLWSSTTGVVHVDRMARGESLRAGASLTSRDGSHRAVMQRDGNLVVHRGSKVLWQSGTRDGSGQARLALGHDGNLVIYGSSGRVLRNFAVEGRGGSELVMRTDGNLTLTTSTGTAVWRNGSVVK